MDQEMLDRIQENLAICSGARPAEAASPSAPSGSFATDAADVVNHIPKCLLFPVGDPEDCDRPGGFLARLYPRLEYLNVVLLHCVSPLPPVYEDPRAPRRIAERGQELKAARVEEAEDLLLSARRVLVRHGFVRDRVSRRVEERGESFGRLASRLAETTQADALLLHRRTPTSVADLFAAERSSLLSASTLAHPVWFTEGNPDATRAAIFVPGGDSMDLGAVDHAAFMLAETGVTVEIVHVAPGLGAPIEGRAGDEGFDLRRWYASSHGERFRAPLAEARRVLEEGGVARERIRVAVIPGRRDPAADLLAYCRWRGIGILAMARGRPPSAFSIFRRRSTAEAVVRAARDTAVWVV